MKNFRAGGIGVVALGCAASFLLTLSVTTSLAQRGGPSASAVGRRTDTLNRQGEQYERERLAREGRRGSADAPGDKRRAQDLAEQVRRDFERLQAAYNKIVLAMAPKSSYDPGQIFDEVEEVGKCAARLKANLALPKAEDAEDEARGAAGAAQVEDSLLTLRKHIYSFVTNPLFEAGPVLDVEQARKAGRDLDMILELSESIRRGGRAQGPQD